MKARVDRRQVLLVGLSVGTLSAGAFAQFIGPVPDAPPKREKFVPAPAAPAPEAVENEPLAPSITKTDTQGRLMPLTTSAEEAAVTAYPLKPERRQLADKSIAARRRDLERFVLLNLDKVLAAYDLRDKVAQASEFNTLFAARDVVAALKQERLLDRLQRDGAINPQQRVRLDETVRNYELALKQQFDKDTAGDPTRQAILNLRQTFTDATREHFEALDRVLDRLAADPAAVAAKAGLDDRKRDALAGLTAVPQDARVATFRTTISQWPSDQREALVTALVSETEK